MRTTPPVPPDLREFSHRAYVNVYERLPAEVRFFGTETLYGDWDAPVLLLAQDCGLVDALDQRIAQGHPTPHGHGEGLPTNVKLAKLAAQITQPKLYGSALGSLWRRDGSKRGKPPEWEVLLPSFVVPMLEWAALEGRFIAVACLGEYAWEALMTAGERPDAARCWQQFRDSGQHLDIVLAGRQIRAFAMYHPANPRGYDLLGTNWGRLAAFLNSHRFAGPSPVPTPVSPAAQSHPAEEGSIMHAPTSAFMLPAGATLRVPPENVPRPLDLTKSHSPTFRQPVLVALAKAGRKGLTIEECGRIAYPNDSDAVRRGKQRKLVLNICTVDGHSIVFLTVDRVALAHFFRP
jgi:hypothetical protein